MMGLLLDAALMTLGLALVSLVVGLLLALLLSAAELSRYRLLRWPVVGLTTLIRGLPEILVVLFVYFGSSQLLFYLTGDYVEFSPFWCGVVALALLFASYGTQTLRAALNAVPLGQWQAARALGLPVRHTFLRIVLPQAWRHAIPGLGNQWLVLLKDTALVSLIGVNDLMRQAQMNSASSYAPFTWYALAAAIYLLITLVSGWWLKRARLHAHRYGG
ncbi:arginine ABC transporter permease ArtQ [Pseudaeromonas paramecii]|uniref:Arginine ABC transporter permease ArtQ n=1 Tax=Pseudaeromonas paramecii TaxID=2138166 RepID=A0ABP8QD92_9GAMM